ARSRLDGSGTDGSDGLKVRNVGSLNPPPLAKVLTKAPVLPLYSKTLSLAALLTKRSPLGPNAPKRTPSSPPMTNFWTEGPSHGRISDGFAQRSVRRPTYRSLVTSTGTPKCVRTRSFWSLRLVTGIHRPIARR